MPLLLKEFPLSSDVPGGMPEYRRSLTVSFFFKFFWSVRGQLPGIKYFSVFLSTLAIYSNVTGIIVDPELKSLSEPFHRPTANSVQGFQQVNDKQPSTNPVGQPVMHLSALLQASGEAHYTDDIARQEGEMYAGLVMSTHAHAKISVDWSLALHLDGIHGYVSVADVPGSNFTGLFGDEKVFADGEVTHFGQIIGMVLGNNQLLAQRAAKLVNVSYTDLPSIITIEVRKLLK